MSSDSTGLMSNAGLVRYFDAEDSNSITFDPRAVVVMSLLFGVVVQFGNLAV